MIVFSLVYGKSVCVWGELPKRSIIKGNDASSVSFLWSGRLLFPEFLNLGAVTDRRLWTYTLLSVSSEMDENWDPFQQWALSDCAFRSPHLIPRSRRKAMCCLPGEGGVYHYTSLEQNWTLENLPRLLILLALQYLQWLDADWVHCGTVD